MIKILDCTLRDGGYVNDWNFGQKTAQDIISLLDLSGIDYIETGFVSDEVSNSNRTVFNSFDDINSFLPENTDKNKLLCMITCGKYRIEKVPNVKNSPLSGIRFIFKKHKINEAILYAKELKAKGYKLFINPTYIHQYTIEEVLDLIKKVNEISPYCLSIVDSMGVLRERELLNLYKIFDENLNNDIAICFHSHNNLQLSFSNAKALINTHPKREFIIDSTIFGIGRWAGNLSTELLIQYLNNFDKRYNITPILKAVDNYINPIFLENPWGYSIVYYLAAINKSHPSYAKYLSKKSDISFERMNCILKNIPDDKKDYFDEKYISEVFVH